MHTRVGERDLIMVKDPLELWDAYRERKPSNSPEMEQSVPDGNWTNFKCVSSFLQLIAVRLIIHRCNKFGCYRQFGKLQMIVSCSFHALTQKQVHHLLHFQRRELSRERTFLILKAHQPELRQIRSGECGQIYTIRLGF